MSEKDVTILYSGGLDSLVMKYYADTEMNLNVKCLWFDIGQPYARKEENVLPDFVEKRNVDWLKVDQELVSKSDSSSGSIIIPGRNAVLATLAASINLPDEIWLGALLGETHKGSTDKNQLFLNTINSMLGYVHSPYKENITVKFPLVELGFGKYEAVKYLLDQGATEKEIHQTSSCLSSEPGNCGRCVVCLRRWGIFYQLGIEEQYNVDPLTVIENKHIMFLMLDGEDGLSCHYDEYRRREIIPALFKYFNTNDTNKIRGKIF